LETQLFNPSLKRDVSKTLSKPEEFETIAFRFLVKGKILRAELFENAGAKIMM